MDVSSTPGEGTTLVVRVPASSTHATTTTEVTAS
jgi:hypothetical protein